MFTRTDFDQFIAGLKYPPNDFQLKAHEEIAFGKGNIVVSALAGSGKTTLLVQTAELFKAMGVTSVGYLAFNVSIKNELNERLPMPYRAINSHSLGMQVLKTANAKTKVNTNKWSGIAKGLMSKIGVEPQLQYTAGKAFQALCSKVMLNMVDPHDVNAVSAIAEQYGLDTVTVRMIQVLPDAIEEAKHIWKMTGEINFDEMLYWPVVLNMQPPQHDFFLVDECQDLNILQQELAFRSIKPTGRMIFVGDQRQAIYAFAGADAASFQRIITKTNAVVMPLNICYRCPTSHLELTRKLVPAIEARQGAPKGIIDYTTEDKVPQLAKAGALVMCRLTAPLVSLYFKLIQNKVRAKVMGKDIGAQLITIMEKVARHEGFSYDRAIEYLEKYREHQVMNLMQREGMEQKIENVNDQVETLVVCITNFDSAKNLQMLKDVLEDLFGDQDKENWKSMVTLCTVHRAKGLEADETFLLKPDKMPLVWKDQRPDEYEQELNILYVALTRSKNKMTVVGELSPILGQTPVQKQLEVEKAEAKPEPVQPTLLPVEAFKPLPAPAPMKDFSTSIERFRTAAKQVEIKPVVVDKVQDKPRAAYSERVMKSLEALSTGELIQMMTVLEAILDERKERV